MSSRFTVHGLWFSVPCSRFTFHCFLVIVFLFAFRSANAQQAVLSTFDEGIILDQYLNGQTALTTQSNGSPAKIQTATFHSSVRPYVNADVRQYYHWDEADSFHITYDLNVAKYAGRFSNDLIYAKTEDLNEDAYLPDWSFGIKPIYELSAGYDLKRSKALFTTAAGVRTGGDFRGKLGYDLRLAAGIVTLPNYQDSLASTFGVIPGWGDRAYALDTSGKYGFQHLSGNIIWRPTPVFNLQVGRDKHFWGDGHRSLFLGDQGPAIPYIKAQTTIWKLQYTSLFTWLQDWTQSTGSKNDFRSKFASMHYLSVNFTKWLNIGVFESVVWQGTDNNRSRWFDANYLNPLVFFRPVEYSIGSSDNAMLGIAGKIRFNRNNVLYGQIILDEFYLKEIKAWKDGWWANKQGVQIGYKCYNFGQVENFLMQMEMNIVRPYTYSHGSPQQSYTNGGMPLAHPMGANFAEMIGILSYHWNGLTVTGKLVGIRFGKDNDTTNFGQDIFKSYITREKEYGNKLFQGNATNVFLAEFNASYVFNTKFPLRLQLTAGARSEKTFNRRLKSSYVMAGLCLPLWRAQRDY